MLKNQHFILKNHHFKYKHALVFDDIRSVEEFRVLDEECHHNRYVFTILCLRDAEKLRDERALNDAAGRIIDLKPHHLLINMPWPSNSRQRVHLWISLEELMTDCRRSRLDT